MDGLQRTHVQRLLPRPECSLATARETRGAATYQGDCQMPFETTEMGDRGLSIRRPPSPSISCGCPRKPARSRRPLLRKMRASRLRDGNLTQATRAVYLRFRAQKRRAAGLITRTRRQRDLGQQNVCSAYRGCFQRLRRRSAEPKDAGATTGRSGRFSDEATHENASVSKFQGTLTIPRSIFHVGASK